MNFADKCFLGWEEGFQTEIWGSPWMRIPSTLTKGQRVQAYSRSFKIMTGDLTQCVAINRMLWPRALMLWVLERWLLCFFYHGKDTPSLSSHSSLGWAIQNLWEINTRQISELTGCPPNSILCLWLFFCISVFFYLPFLNLHVSLQVQTNKLDGSQLMLLPWHRIQQRPKSEENLRVSHWRARGVGNTK